MRSRTLVSDIAAHITGAAKVGRKLRKPRHEFQVRNKPFCIQPTAIAPVLPGETLENAFLQCRTVTAPVRHSLIGWWEEHYLFYVPHIALDGAADFKEMMLNKDKDLSAYIASGDEPRYFYNNLGINWTKLCTKVIVEEFFRFEGEAWDVAAIDGLPIAQVMSDRSWMNSLIPADEVADGTADFADGATAETIDDAFRMWEFLRLNQLSNATYEDYLASNGVKGKTIDDEQRPELIRYIRQWQYPSNTVDPASGTPTAAVSWAVGERADKKRFFKYPGFLIGLTVCRPKVYYNGQESAASATLLDNAFMWLPAVLAEDPWTSLREFSDTQGPIATVAGEAYKVDVRDLYIYGDQFRNYDRTDTEPADAIAWGSVALPTATIGKRYVSEADVDSLFKADGTATNEHIHKDGVWQFNIRSVMASTDHTPSDIIAEG